MLALASCVKEDPSGDGPEVPQAPEGYGFLSLAIDINGQALLTRSQQAPAEEEGTAEENHVAKVRLVLYSDDVVQYAFDFNIRTKADGSGYEEYGVGADELPHLYESYNAGHFITFARQIRRTNYKMLLIVNPTKSDTYYGRDLYALTGEGQSISNIMSSDYTEVYNPVDYRPSGWYTGDTRPTHEQIRDEDGGIAAPNYFLMTNHRGFIDVPADRLRNTANSSNHDPVRVEVSRAVAKVVVASRAPEVMGNATAFDFKWELDVTNQKSFWMRMPTNMTTDDGSIGEMEPEFDPNDPNRPERQYLYGKDPNFSELSDQGAPDPLYEYLTGQERLDELFELRWREFNYLAYPTNDQEDPSYIVPVPCPALTLPLGAVRYCLENTMALSDQHEDVTTRLIVSCTYWPAGYEDEGGYYIYNDYYVLPSEMKAFKDDDMEVPDELAGIKTDMAALLADKGIDAAQPQTESFSANNIRYYHAGLNYYAVDIVHSRQAGYGHYGILRNNVYRITLEAVRGPGSPTVINPEAVNLSSAVNVLQWWGRLQYVEL